MSELWIFAVTMMTGSDARLCDLRRRRSTPMPSMSGIITSRRTASNRCSSARPSASRPPSASVTWKPRRWKRRVRIARFSAMSSTIRRRGAASSDPRDHSCVHPATLLCLPSGLPRDSPASPDENSLRSPRLAPRSGHSCRNPQAARSSSRAACAGRSAEAGSACSSSTRIDAGIRSVKHDPRPRSLAPDAPAHQRAELLAQRQAETGSARTGRRSAPRPGRSSGTASRARPSRSRCPCPAPRSRPSRPPGRIRGSPRP